MKTIILILMTSFLFVPQQQAKLMGTYRVEFDKKYGKNGYQIIFNDSIFRATMPDAVMYKGKITYDKYKTTFRCTKDENPMEINNSEISGEVIKFCTRNKTDLYLVVNRGRLIRVK